jgi:glycerol-3-phosphate acyltransferase PlsY
MSTLVHFCTLPFLAYLLGSVPFGLVLTKLFTNIDIRREGSGNIGATNVRRVAGTPLGLSTLAADILKGCLPVWLALRLVPMEGTWGHGLAAVVGLAAFGGHLYPLYLKFRDGGKGVATALGCLLALNPMTLLVTLLTYILFLCLTGRSSVGSLTAAVMMPLAMGQFQESKLLIAATGIMTIMIVIRHQDNIKRLASGKEPKVW